MFAAYVDARQCTGRCIESGREHDDVERIFAVAGTNAGFRDSHGEPELAKPMKRTQAGNACTDDDGIEV